MTDPKILLAPSPPPAESKRSTDPSFLLTDLTDFSSVEVGDEVEVEVEIEIERDELIEEVEHLLRQNNSVDRNINSINHSLHTIDPTVELVKSQMEENGGSNQNQREETDDDDDDDDLNSAKFPLHVEVRIISNSTILYDTVRRVVGSHITDNFSSLESHAEIPGWREVKLLEDEVHSVYCAESVYPSTLVPLAQVNLHIHVYEVPPQGKDQLIPLCVNAHDSSNFDSGTGMDDGATESQEGDVAAIRLELPANRLEGIWESLIYEIGLKDRLLNYIYSSIIFAEQNVNPSLISWHKLVLLHGPPGTGKTSMCRALAQKVSIRLSGIYMRTELVEINSHSLFSKWFSESGKLVDCLFTRIEQMTEESDVFVVVLIDEVESLAGSRLSGAAESEPSDALRAVNALLTALDKLRNLRNVLLLTTSNLTGSIDGAFLDRVDIKQYIGLPTPEAIYWILKTCVEELAKVGILGNKEILDYKETLMIRDQLSEVGRVENFSKISIRNAESRVGNSQKSKKYSLILLEVAESAVGMSGRALRRLPLLAHARATMSRPCSKRLNVKVYLEAMLQCVKEEQDST